MRPNIIQIQRRNEGKSNGNAGKKRRNIRGKKEKKSKSKKSKYRVVTQDLDDPEIELNLPFMNGNKDASQR